jgi:hypothetical protein
MIYNSFEGSSMNENTMFNKRMRRILNQISKDKTYYFLLVEDYNFLNASLTRLQNYLNNKKINKEQIDFSTLEPIDFLNLLTKNDIENIYKYLSIKLDINI